MHKPNFSPTPAFVILWHIFSLCLYQLWVFTYVPWCQCHCGETFQFIRPKACWSLCIGCDLDICFDMALVLQMLLQFVPLASLSAGSLLADLVVAIGTIDLVVGELDR